MPDRLHASHQWMCRIHLIVAVCRYQQQMSGIRGICKQMLDKFQARSIDPLHIIEEQYQRMFFPGEHTDKLPEYFAKTVLSLGRRKRRHRRLFADDEFDLWQQLHNELAVDADGFPDLLPPASDASLAFGQELFHQFPKCLRKSDIGNITLVLIEFSRNEIALPFHDR
ncbi:MAG TPA: hypothetical protein VF450_20500, partial [Noviherbaspirillum sp.]